MLAPAAAGLQLGFFLQLSTLQMQGRLTPTTVVNRLVNYTNIADMPCCSSEHSQRTCTYAVSSLSTALCFLSV